MFSMRAVFIGPNGLRAGWRLLIFFAMLVPLYFGTGPIIDFAMRRVHQEISTPVGALVVFSITFAVLFLASGIMARIEGRSIADYGLPWRRAFCGQFWQGAAISFVSLTALLCVLVLREFFLSVRWLCTVPTSGNTAFSGPWHFLWAC
jgi:hypothetical protein